MNKYKITDINNTSYYVTAEDMSIETINNVETYIAFYDAEERHLIAVFSLSNIIAVVREN